MTDENTTPADDEATDAPAPEDNGNTQDEPTEDNTSTDPAPVYVSSGSDDSSAAGGSSTESSEQPATEDYSGADREISEDVQSAAGTLVFSSEAALTNTDSPEAPIAVVSGGPWPVVSLGDNGLVEIRTSDTETAWLKLDV